MNWSALLQNSIAGARSLGGAAAAAGRGIGSGAAAAGRGFGWGTMAASRGIASGASSLAEAAVPLARAAAPTAIRSGVGSGIGFGTGFGANLYAGGDVDSATRTGLAGAAAGAGLANPGFRRFMFAPRYPWLDKAAPRTANLLRKMPYASMGIGTTLAYDAAANSSSDIAEDLSRRVGMTNNNDIANIRSRAYWNYPNALWRAYAPEAMGGDVTPFGTAMRNTISKTFVPSVRAGVANIREMYPVRANMIDALRLTTPAGAAATAYMRMLPRAQFPNIPEVTRNELAEQLPNMLRNPSATSNSPGLRLLSHTLFSNNELSRIDPKHLGGLLHGSLTPSSLAPYTAPGTPGNTAAINAYGLGARAGLPILQHATNSVNRGEILPSWMDSLGSMFGSSHR